jgi:NADH:ubiquinone oxidoreductase subunit 5 (subunit L)/multisubunit Na+/H+ antiporter MnhA subunit
MDECNFERKYALMVVMSVIVLIIAVLVLLVMFSIMKAKIINWDVYSESPNFKPVHKPLIAIAVVLVALSVVCAFFGIDMSSSDDILTGGKYVYNEDGTIKHDRNGDYVIDYTFEREKTTIKGSDRSAITAVCMLVAGGVIYFSTFRKVRTAQKVATIYATGHNISQDSVSNIHNSEIQISFPELVRMFYDLRVFAMKSVAIIDTSNNKKLWAGDIKETAIFNISGPMIIKVKTRTYGSAMFGIDPNICTKFEIFIQDNKFMMNELKANGTTHEGQHSLF